MYNSCQRENQQNGLASVLCQMGRWRPLQGEGEGNLDLERLLPEKAEGHFEFKKKIRRHLCISGLLNGDL